MTRLILTAGCWDEDREAARVLFNVLYGAPSDSFVSQRERPGDERPRWWLSMPVQPNIAHIIEEAKAGRVDAQVAEQAGIPAEQITALVGRMDIAPFDGSVSPSDYVAQVGDTSPEDMP